MINLTYTTKLLSYDFFRTLKKHGIADQQYNLLRILRGFRSVSPILIGFIKGRMPGKDWDVNRIVDRINKKGFLTRNENPEDRRQKSVEITKKGLALPDSMFDCEMKADTLLNNLSKEEIHELNRLPDKIRQNR